MKRLLAAVSTALLLSLPAASHAGSTQAPQSAPKAAQSPEDKERDALLSLSLYMAVDAALNKYVDEIPKHELYRLAIDGIMSKLDPHSQFLPPRDADQLRESMAGNYAGVGILVGRKNRSPDTFEAKEVHPDGPAAKAGVSEGDILKGADGKRFETLESTVTALRGAPGSTVSIDVIRNGKALSFPVKRSKIISSSVGHKTVSTPAGPVLFVRIRSFSSTTVSEMARALDIGLRGALPMGGASAIVIDLRDNPGGGLESSIFASAFFLKKGETVVSAKNRGKVVEMWRAMVDSNENSAEDMKTVAQTRSRHPELFGPAAIPLVVMTNNRSASASEIMAAALQDNGRAKIVGERTFGKGSVQSFMPLAPTVGAIKITVARYHSPSGRTIQADGVHPDIPAVDSRESRETARRNEEAFNLVKKAKPASRIDQREADIPGHLSPSPGFKPSEKSEEKPDKAIEAVLEDSNPAPNERMFSYSPEDSRGGFDNVTAKALSSIPKNRHAIASGAKPNASAR